MRIARDRAVRACTPGPRQKLARRKAEQRERFDRLSAEAAARFAGIRSLIDEASVVPYWARSEERLEHDLVSDPPFDFLRHPVVLETMQVRGPRALRGTVRALEDRCGPGRLRPLLEEDLVGVPVLDCRRYACSHTLVHHLYHLERFAEATGEDWRRVERIVELGAGYGSLARLVRRNAERPPTHVIVDLPVPALLQWLFLGSIFGAEHVDLLDSPRPPVPGRITIVPAGLADRVELTADLFVSTWALSEIARAAQDRVAAAEWFGAERILVAFQHSSEDFPDAAHTEELLRSAGAAIEPLRVVGGSSYGFR
jgi:hypothetical protein